MLRKFAFSDGKVTLKEIGQYICNDIDNAYKIRRVNVTVVLTHHHNYNGTRKLIIKPAVIVISVTVGVTDFFSLPNYS